jgi:hypothetical protein
MGLENHAVVTDFSKFAEAENLIAAAIRQDGSVPPHEAVQSPKPCHRFLAGPKHEVVGIAQEDLHRKRSQLFRRQAFHGRLRAHRHEDWRLHSSMRQMQAPSAGAGFRIAINDFERQDTSASRYSP